MSGQVAPAVGATIDIEQVPPLSSQAAAVPLDPAADSSDAHVFVVIDVPGRSCTSPSATDSTALCDPLATHKAPTAAILQSSSSSTASSLGELPECRICLSAGETEDLVQPCSCSGSLSYTHTACLSAWVQERGSLVCELCGHHYKEPHAELLEPIAAAAKEAKKYIRASEESPYFCARRTCAVFLLLWIVAMGAIVAVVTVLLLLRRSNPAQLQERS